MAKAKCEAKANLTVGQALGCLGNSAMGKSDLREAAAVASAHRSEIPGATSIIPSEALTADGQRVEVTFVDPRLVLIPAGDREVVILDKRIPQ